MAATPICTGAAIIAGVSTMQRLGDRRNQSRPLQRLTIPVSVCQAVMPHLLGLIPSGPIHRATSPGQIDGRIRIGYRRIGG